MDTPHRTFTIDTCLGRGGFGEVYRAEMATPAGLSSPVALKVLRRDLAPASQAVQRLRDEGALLARLNHPTILKVHDLVVLEGRVALVTEYVEGDDLERCMRGADPMGSRALLEVLGQVAGALDAAYNAPVGDHGNSLKLVHRDVKPSNVRIGRHGEVKLLDFGIARSDEVSREARTATDLMVGSPPYMAPERFLDGELRSASDVFALGAIGLEGLIGGRVFGAPVPMLASLAIDQNRYAAHVEERIARVPPSAPQGLVALYRRMLAYDPERRPTCAEVARACERLAEDLPGPTLLQWCRGRRWSGSRPEAGELDGRVLSEGTLARTWPADSGAFLPLVGGGPVQPPSATAFPQRTWGRGLVVGLGGASVLIAFVVVPALAALAGALVVQIWPRTDPSDPPAIAPLEPPPAPEPAPRPPEREPDHERPEPPPQPVRRDPRSDTPRAEPRAEPRPEPTPKAPEPAEVSPTPPPGPAAPRVHVTFTGVRAVRLSGDAASVDLPAHVPPGTYKVRAVDGEGESQQVFEDVVEIPAGAAVTVTCGTRYRRCLATSR